MNTTTMMDASQKDDIIITSLCRVRNIPIKTHCYLLQESQGSW